MRTEAIHYIIEENGIYVGYPVNMPMIIAQAETISELVGKIAELMKIVCKDFNEIASNKSFELIESKTSYDFRYKLNPERAELERYKQVFGELPKI